MKLLIESLNVTGLFNKKGLNKTMLSLRSVMVFVGVMVLCFNVNASLTSEEHPDGEIHITYGSLWPEGHFARRIAEEFAQEVGEKSDGKLVVHVTPPTADEELTEKVLSGEIQMTSGHGLQTPEVELTYLPYIYKSFDHFKKVWTLGEGPASSRVVDAVEAEGKVKILGYSLIGFRDVILKDRVINHLSDFNDLIIRNDGSKATHDTFEALGASPISIEYHVVKEALKEGRVHAAANTAFNLYYMQWYEECKNISLTEHQMLLNLELVNQGFWNSLSADHQQIIKTAMDNATHRFADTAKEERTFFIKALKEIFHMNVNEVSLQDKEEMAAAVLPLKRRFIEEYGLAAEYEYILSIGALDRES